MGEIRSTLDIIMEKAKNLEVSEKEKVEIRRKEIEAKAKGMVQKFLDGTLSLEDMVKEIGGMDEQDQRWIRESILNDCKERINFEKANEDILKLLPGILGFSPEPVSNLIEKFQKELSREAEKMRDELTQELQNRGIKGTAVIVNHKASPQWASIEARLHKEFREQLEKLLIELYDGRRVD